MPVHKQITDNAGIILVIHKIVIDRTPDVINSRKEYYQLKENLYDLVGRKTVIAYLPECFDRQSQPVMFLIPLLPVHPPGIVFQKLFCPGIYPCTIQTHSAKICIAVHIALPKQRGTIDYSLFKVRIFQMRLDKKCTFQMGILEICIFQMSIAKVRVVQVGTPEVRT